MRYVMFQPSFNPILDLPRDKGQLAMALATRPGWRVTIATYEPVDLPSGLATMAVDRRRMGFTRSICRVAGRADVMQFHNFTWRAAFGARLYRLLNRQGVCYVRLSGSTVAELAAETARLRNPAYRVLLRATLPAVDLISAESAWLLDRFEALLRSCGVRRMPSRLIVCSCGFPLDEVYPRLAAAPSRTDILFVGRMGPGAKAVPVLLAAFQCLREELGVPATLELVGPASAAFEADFARWAAAAAPKTVAAVSRPGAVWDREALLGHYVGARVFAISSRSESGPNVFAEAASCGCLLVGTEVGQVREVIAAVGQGWIAPVGDAGALARALAAALAVPDTLERRHERIGRFAAAYAWSDMVERLASELERIHESRRKRRLGLRQARATISVATGLTRTRPQEMGAKRDAGPPLNRGS